MLKLTSITAPSALLAALTLASAPAFAQERYHGRQNPAGQQSSGQSRERAQPRSEAPREQPGAARVERRQEAPRAQPPQQQQAQQQPQRQAPQQPQRQVERQPQRQAEQPRVDNRSNDNRANNNRSSDNRGYGNGRNDDRRGEAGRAVPRGNVYAPRYEPRYSPRYSPRTYSPRAYSPRGYGYYGSRSYYRPYTFRPRFSIGFGIFAGYPVPYTYSYPYPIVVYGYRAPRERVIVTPGSPYYGGVALEMTPYDADVFVDGEYAGHVEDFDGTTQPLTLSAGMHEIEVQAQGYEPMRVNVEIQPGQVIPYRGDLRPY
jgi:hypothetical protein